MTFKKQKMLDRIEKQGLSKYVNGGLLEMMDNLDGQEAKQIHNCDDLLITGKDGSCYLVKIADCTV